MVMHPEPQLGLWKLYSLDSTRASCRAHIRFPPLLFECNNWIATSCDAQTQTLFRLTPGESGCKIFPRRWMDLEVQLQGWLQMF
jgi:hypothetical protein